MAAAPGRRISRAVMRTILQTPTGNHWAPNTNISPCPAFDDALIEWGAKAGMTLMMNTYAVAQDLIQDVPGTLSARIALTSIVNDSGLTCTSGGDRIRTVFPGVVTLMAFSA